MLKLDRRQGCDQFATINDLSSTAHKNDNESISVSELGKEFKKQELKIIQVSIWLIKYMLVWQSSHFARVTFDKYADMKSIRVFTNLNDIYIGPGKISLRKEKGY